MILSGQSIAARGMITPFCERTIYPGWYGPLTYGVGPAGYDLRVEFEEGVDAVQMEPGDFRLASTVEYFRMDTDVLAVVHDKSTWIRRGLAVHNTVIEPGWRGHLTLELKNVGHVVLRLDRGSPIAQVVFHQVDRVTPGYYGKYQNQRRGPQEAI